MNDARVVGGGKAVGKLAADLDDPGEVVWLTGEATQRRASHMLHDDVAPPVGQLAERVNRADVRVVERRGAARLTLEAVKARRVAHEGGRQDLHRDLAAEASIPGEVDLAHAAMTERFQDLVIAEDVAV